MLRFGLVGCGRIGQRHAQLLSQGQIEGACLASVCDSIASRRDEFARRFSVPSYQALGEMLKRENLDAVIVATPSGNHCEHTLEAAAVGVNVVVEKPMALTLDDADRMIEACDIAGRKLFVVKQNRFNVPVVELKRELDRGALGRRLIGTVRVRWCRDDAYYAMDAWRGTWALDGGVLANQASHHLDALQWMMGGVESVFAYGGTLNSNIEVEDTALAVLRFRSGAMGAIEATTAARPHDFEGSLSVIGDRGLVEIGGKALNQVRVWEVPDGEMDLAPHLSENPPDVYGFGHSRYLNHVVEAIEREGSQLVDGMEGRKSLELILALYESIESRSEVSLGGKKARVRLGATRGD